MRLFFLSTSLIALFLTGQPTKAQPYEIFGKIVSSETKEEIPFASIAIKEIYKGTASNLLGEFSFKVDSLPVDLIISHLSYETREITVTESEELLIELTPGRFLMDEVVVQGTGNSKFAYDLINNAYYKTTTGKGRQERYGKAFYRQISKNGDEYSELYEMFYDTKFSNNGVEDWAIQEGRYALKLSAFDSFIYNKNFTLMVRLLTIVQPPTQDLIMPVSLDVSEQFDLRTERIFTANNRKVAIISFRKKKDIPYPALEGEISIDVDTYEILKLKGNIADDNLNFISLKGKMGSWKNYVVGCELAFQTLENGQLALDYMQLQQNFDYYYDGVFTNKVETKSFFTYYEYYEPPKRKKLGGRLVRFNQRDADVLDAIGYNQLFWDENIIVKRTPIEAEITESFERSRAFGSIYLNNKDQLILEDYAIDNDPFIIEAKQQLRTYELPSTGEKLYIHHDKPVYAQGEEFWFKAYVVNMSTNSRSSNGKVLNINLISPGGQKIYSGRFRIEEGISFGKMDIPSGLASGYYDLIAYSDWMEQFPERLFFRKKIPVINTSDASDNLVTSAKDTVSRFRYYAEGGSLIDGVPGQLGFVATNSTGLPVEVKGRLLNQDGRQAALLNSEFQGFGSVFIMPRKSNELRTMITSGVFEQSPIPEIKDEGYSMLVNNLKPNTLDITVRATPMYEGRKFYLLVISNGVLFDRRIGIITKGLYRTEVPETVLPGGIAQILLVDDLANIQCRRNIFISSPDAATVKYYLPKKDFKPGERVDMVLEINDQNGKSLGLSNISVSVVDSDKVSRSAAQQNIRSYFYLDYLLDFELNNSGELFLDYERETLKKFEWLMLNQQFILPEIRSFSGNRPAEQDGITAGNGLTGQAFVNAGIPLSNGYISFISYPDAGKGAWYLRTDENGYFTIPDIRSDSSRTIVMAWDEKGIYNAVHVYLGSEVYFGKRENALTGNLPADATIKKYAGLLSKDPGIASTQTPVAKRTVAKSNTPDVSPGKPAQVVSVAGKTNEYANALQLLRRGVVGLEIENEDKNMMVRIKGNDRPALVIIDGLILNAELLMDHVTNIGLNMESRLKSIALGSIDRVEVIKETGNYLFYGKTWTGGVIAIYSINTENFFPQYESDILKEIWLPGLEQQNDFLIPEYSSQTGSRGSRSTLYWNPDITTNRKGRAKISFINSESARNMQLCVEGVTQQGIPVFDIFEFGRNASRSGR